MIRVPLCGTVSGAATDTVTIFIGSESCFGAVVFNNTGTGAVDIIKDGNATPLATLETGTKLSVIVESLSSLGITFTAASTVSYKGCICSNSTQCCQIACDTV